MKFHATTTYHLHTVPITPSQKGQDNTSEVSRYLFALANANLLWLKLVNCTLKGLILFTVIASR